MNRIAWMDPIEHYYWKRKGFAFDIYYRTAKIFICEGFSSQWWHFKGCLFGLVMKLIETRARMLWPTFRSGCRLLFFRIFHPQGEIRLVFAYSDSNGGGGNRRQRGMWNSLSGMRRSNYHCHSDVGAQTIVFGEFKFFWLISFRSPAHEGRIC